MLCVDDILINFKKRFIFEPLCLLVNKAKDYFPLMSKNIEKHNEP